MEIKAYGARVTPSYISLSLPSLLYLLPCVLSPYNP